MGLHNINRFTVAIFAPAHTLTSSANVAQQRTSYRDVNANRNLFIVELFFANVLCPKALVRPYNAATEQE